MVGFLYVGDYKPDEETMLNEAGVPTARWPSVQEEDGSNISGDPIFVRSSRLLREEYATLWTAMQSRNVNLVTALDAFEKINRFELHYPSIADISPRAIIVPAAQTEDEIAARINQENLSYPVFVRSEIESSAKYVGLDGCIMRAPERADLRRVLDNLRQHVRGYNTVVFKEMLPIATTPNGDRLEYRAIGAKGKFIAFDYSISSSSLPAPEQFGLEAFAARAFANLAQGGANGAAFVDVAVTESGQPIVVECKDFANGTIKAIQSLIDGLKHFRE